MIAAAGVVDHNVVIASLNEDAILGVIGAGVVDHSVGTGKKYVDAI